MAATGTVPALDSYSKRSARLTRSRDMAEYEKQFTFMHQRHSDCEKRFYRSNNINALPLQSNAAMYAARNVCGSGKSMQARHFLAILSALRSSSKDRSPRRKFAPRRLWHLIWALSFSTHIALIVLTV